MSERPPRSAAEWTTFGVAVVILAAVLAAIGLQAARSDEPAAPAAVASEATRVGDVFHVPVTVTNEGDETAEAVQVLASLEIEGETVEAEQTVDFLAGGDQQKVVFTFADDPADAELTVRVGSYLVP